MKIICSHTRSCPRAHAGHLHGKRCYSRFLSLQTSARNRRTNCVLSSRGPTGARGAPHFDLSLHGKGTWGADLQPASLESQLPLTPQAAERKPHIPSLSPDPVSFTARSCISPSAMTMVTQTSAPAPQDDLKTVVETRNREWHFHIYFLLQSPAEKAAALALRDAVLKLRRDGKSFEAPPGGIIH